MASNDLARLVEETAKLSGVPRYEPPTIYLGFGDLKINDYKALPAQEQLGTHTKLEVYSPHGETVVICHKNSEKAAYHLRWRKHEESALPSMSELLQLWQECGWYGSVPTVMFCTLGQAEALAYLLNIEEFQKKCIVVGVDHDSGADWNQFWKHFPYRRSRVTSWVSLELYELSGKLAPKKHINVYSEHIPATVEISKLLEKEHEKRTNL